MAFTSGNATDYQDLLDRLRLYLVAQGWTQLSWVPASPGGGGADYGGDAGTGAGAVYSGGVWFGNLITVDDDTQISSVVYSLQAAQNGINATPVIYANNAGAAGAILAQGPTVVDGAVGDNVLPLAAPLNVSAGDQIWVGCYQANVGSILATKTAGASSMYFIDDLPANDPGGALTAWSERLRIFARSGGAVAVTSSTLKVRGPGAGAGREVFLNVRTVSDPISSVYSWKFRTSPTYDGSLDWGAQLSEQPNDAYFNLWQNAIPYWFYVNDRRLIVVAKTGTNYVSMHAGFFLPWGTPVQYPFPLYAAGDFNSAVPYSTNNSARRMCFDPGNVSNASPNGWARSADGVWYPMYQVANSSNTNLHRGPTKGSRGFVWPFSAGYGASNGVGQYNPLSWNGGGGSFDHEWGGEFFAQTQQGERCLMPIMPVGGDMGPMGVIDGAYAVGGLGLGPEQIITIGARNFRAFQNVQRNSPDDFFCVEEI